MTDIAQELGISKRTLYEVFRDKEELLEKCLDFHYNKTDKELERLTVHSENVIDTLIRLYAKNFHQVLSVSKSLVNDLKKYHGHLYRKNEERHKKGMYNFIPLLEKGVEQGLIRKDINFEIMLWLLKIQFNAVIDETSFPSGKYSINQFVQTIIQNFLRGIATPLGNERIDQLMEHYKDYEIKI